MDTVTSNSPNGMKMIVVAGTPSATPTSASAGTIQTAVGASNPYIIISYVRVNATVTSITTANITDARQFIEPQVLNTPSSYNLQDCVRSGGTIATVSGLTVSLSNIVYTVSRRRYAINNFTNLVMTASRDNYIDIAAGNSVPTVTAVVNGAASPVLAANSVRIGIVSTGAATVNSIVQVGFDSLGNMIYRTKRLSCQVMADNTASAIQYAHIGSMVQYAIGASGFGRGFFTIPDDMDLAANAIIKFKGYSTTTTVASTSTLFLGHFDIGTDQTAAWNMLSGGTLPSVTYTANLVNENVYQFSPTSPVVFKKGAHLGFAYRFVATSTVMVLVSAYVDYRPLGVV